MSAALSVVRSSCRCSRSARSRQPSSPRRLARSDVGETSGSDVTASNSTPSGPIVHKPTSAPLASKIGAASGTARDRSASPSPLMSNSSPKATTVQPPSVVSANACGVADGRVGKFDNGDAVARPEQLGDVSFPDGSIASISPARPSTAAAVVTPRPSAPIGVTRAIAPSARLAGDGDAGDRRGADLACGRRTTPATTGVARRGP